MEEIKNYGYKDNPQACFKKAIRDGRLSECATALNYAGHYMYMGTKVMTDRDMFKNIMTRQYDV